MKHYYVFGIWELGGIFGGTFVVYIFAFQDQKGYSIVHIGYEYPNLLKAGLWHVLSHPHLGYKILKTGNYFSAKNLRNIILHFWEQLGDRVLVEGKLSYHRDVTIEVEGLAYLVRLDSLDILYCCLLPLFHTLLEDISLILSLFLLKPSKIGLPHHPALSKMSMKF